MSLLERDPNKRRVKPVETQASILDFDLEGESSDDSDFRIEDHPEVSDDYDSENSNQGDKISSDGDTEESDSDELKALNNVKSNGLSISDVIQQANSQLKGFSEKDVQQISICCGCLGDQSDGINEIVECDSCGVTVHEACYGISDSASLASTDSLSPTAPWFCDTCKAGVKDPVCELCPNSGGIFKETDVGKWIHLVCALYVPGVAFGEVDKLTGVTLFEMPYSKWGAKSCSLCPDERFARTGVCIGCDAGMCKTYFHVTCAQREGFLSEAHSEEVDQADPFYAHCRMHSDKTLVKRRKRNYLALQLRTHYRRVQFEQEGHSETPEQLRIQRKLEKQRVHFLGHKALKPPPWVPTQKMPRLLTTSASACRKLLRKAELMGINTTVLEMQEAHAAALVDVRKKWHIPPAFTVEFIAYYLDRNDRLKGMKETLERLLDGNRRLLEEQQSLRVRYDELLKTNTEETKKNVDLKQTIHKFHSAILSACPTKNLPNIEDLGKPLISSGATVSAAQTMIMARTKAHQPMMVPTAAALKMGVGFPLNNMIQGGGRGDRILSSQAVVKPESLMLNECGICRQKRDQHLLAKCDTCHLYYHLDCLNPPLTRLPKKSKLYGWQCSECDKSSDSEMEEVKTPRRSKSRYSREARLSKEGAAAAAAAAASKVLDSSAATTPGGATTTSTGTPKLKIKAPGHGDDEDEEEEDEADVSRIGGSSQRSMPRRDSSLSSSNKMEISSEINGHPPSSGTPMDLKEGENNSASMMMMGHNMSSSSKSGKKRRREKHKNRYSPELTSSSKEHKRKRKKKSIDLDADEQPMIVHPRITIKIKPIPLPEGEVASESNPQCFYVPSEDNDNLPPTVTVKVIPPPLSNAAPADITNASNKTASTSSSAAAITGSSSSGGGAAIAMERRNMSPKVSLGAKVTLRGSTGSGGSGGGGNAAATTTSGGTSTSGGTLTGVCDVCKTDSFTANSVKCDDCQKNYHFTCLDPPVKKSPKRRGYSWHCADCDPTGSE